MPMQHIFSFTLAEAWAFLIYAAVAAAGLYTGGVAISKVITAVKKPKTDQEKRITQLETRVNAMELYGISQTEGEEYFARYTTKEDYL